MKVRALALVAVGMILGGGICEFLHFDGDYGRLGAIVMILGGQCALTAFFAGKRGTLDDAFEAGYQAGFHRGQRTKPKVIRLPTERHQERA